MNDPNNNPLNFTKISYCKIALRSLLTLLLTITIFAVIFSRIKITEVMVLLKQTDIIFLGLAILFSVFAHVLFSPARYQHVVQAMGCKMSFFEAVIIRMGSNPIKGILPSKIGELAVVIYMKTTHHLSYPKGLLSLLPGYLFSFVVLIIFYSLGGIFYFDDPVQKIISALLFLLILFLISPFSLRLIPQFWNWFIHNLQKLFKELKSSSLEQYDSRTIKFLSFYSLGVEGSKLMLIFIILKSFNINIPFDALLLLGSITIIAAYIPISYWGLGIRESAMLFLFSSYATPDKLLAGSLLITFVDGLLPALIGLFFLKPFLNRLWEVKKFKMEITSAD